MQTDRQEAINTLDAVRLYVAFLAGQNRLAQVETLAGWVDLDNWKGYGTDRSGYVQFYFDPDRSAIRERPTPGESPRCIIDQQAVFGVWPVRFVKHTTLPRLIEGKPRT